MTQAQSLPLPSNQARAAYEGRYAEVTPGVVRAWILAGAVDGLGHDAPADRP
jgi:hypothetical protein